MLFDISNDMVQCIQFISHIHVREVNVGTSFAFYPQHQLKECQRIDPTGSYQRLIRTQVTQTLQVFLLNESVEPVTYRHLSSSSFNGGTVTRQMAQGDGDSNLCYIGWCQSFAYFGNLRTADLATGGSGDFG
jgi:hypothetical protein